MAVWVNSRLDMLVPICCRGIQVLNFPRSKWGSLSALYEGVKNINFSPLPIEFSQFFFSLSYDTSEARNMFPRVSAACDPRNVFWEPQQHGYGGIRSEFSGYSHCVPG